MSPGLALSVATVAAATVAGAWVAARQPGRREIVLAVAAGVLAVIAGFDLLPDAWSEARRAGLPAWTVPAAAVASFVSAGLVARLGCTCQIDLDRRSGSSTAAALAAHRWLEGAAIALTGSVAVAAALAVHAFGEGLAVGSLLGAGARGRAAAWLGIMCVSPVLGATVVRGTALPAAAEPVLVALVAGVLAQAARISMRSSRLSSSRPGRSFLPAPSAVAAMLTATFTIGAVRVTG